VAYFFWATLYTSISEAQLNSFMLRSFNRPTDEVDLLLQLEQKIKQTGETIQIVKTLLAMKMQAEQKLVSDQCTVPRHSAVLGFTSLPTLSKY